jgi:hypothetical protein
MLVKSQIILDNAMQRLNETERNFEIKKQLTLRLLNNLRENVEVETGVDKVGGTTLSTEVFMLPKSKHDELKALLDTAKNSKEADAADLLILSLDELINPPAPPEPKKAKK